MGRKRKLEGQRATFSVSMPPAMREKMRGVAAENWAEIIRGAIEAKIAGAELPPCFTAYRIGAAWGVKPETVIAAVGEGLFPSPDLRRSALTGTDFEGDQFADLWSVFTLHHVAQDNGHIRLFAWERYGVTDADEITLRIINEFESARGPEVASGPYRF